jgi:hypothetical protein
MDIFSMREGHAYVDTVRYWPKAVMNQQPSGAA